MQDIMTSKQLGLLLGVLYGVLVRILWEVDLAQYVDKTVLIAMLLFVPAVFGFLQIYYDSYIEGEPNYSRMIVLPWQPVLVFSLVVFVTLLENSLWCIQALPAFLLFASLGGILAGIFRRNSLKKSYALACSAMVLPLLVLMVDLNIEQLPLVH